MPTKIVIADDRRQMAGLVERLRQHSDYEVAYCALDAEAFKCIKDHAPDLVVLDMAELHTSGLNLLSVIRTDSTLSVLPIVVCATPSPEITQLLNQLALMQLYVIPSPYGIDQVTDKIEEALAKAKSKD